MLEQRSKARHEMQGKLSESENERGDRQKTEDSKRRSHVRGLAVPPVMIIFFSVT